ncbi:MAG: glycosyltransferase [Ignavibacteriae bacterium]|nr:glycosyltransferase [Ignavibacteriota bacterium]
MNVFIIPSWYPNEKNPVSGIFIKEQVDALSDLFPDINFAVSLCGDLSYSIHLKKPIYSIKVLKEYSKEKPYVVKRKENLIEIYNPVLLWTDKLNGYNKNLVKANLKNYLLAEKELGKIDIIHCHVSYPAGYIGMKLSEKTKVPFVITEHMGPFPFENFIKDGKLSDDIKNPIEKANKVIAVSNALVDSVFGFGIDKPVVIPNLVNESTFFPGNIKNESGKFTFFTLCSMIDSKGVMDLLQAIKIVADKNKNVLFRLAGEGEDLEKYMSYTKQNGLDNYVNWIGKLEYEKILSEYQNCDCFILTSKHESFGVVYAEAIACGKPLIATKCGGPEDIVNEDNGLLVEAGNVEEIANSILYMVDNINRYDSQKIRENFLNRFSRKVVTEKIVNVYKECLK